MQLSLSTSKKFCLLLAGFADYGVQVNPIKTRLSFDMTTAAGQHLQARRSKPFRRQKLTGLAITSDRFGVVFHILLTKLNTRCVIGMCHQQAMNA